MDAILGMIAAFAIMAVITYVLHLWDKAHPGLDSWGFPLPKQREKKTEDTSMDIPEMMEYDWCGDCDGDPAECYNLGYCKQMQALNKELFADREDDDVEET